MTLAYGVLKAKVASDAKLIGSRKRRETQYHLRLDLDADGATWEVDLNVGTSDADDLLRYKLVYDYAQPLIQMLAALPPGPTVLTGAQAPPALDFLRGGVLAETGPWRRSDVMDGSEAPEPVASLLRLLARAREQAFDIYVYGRFFTDGQGVHDTHMNQGSTGSFLHRPDDDANDHNDVWQDGALFVDLGQPEFAAYFAAFTNQLVPTDPLGNPEPNSEPLGGRSP